MTPILGIMASQISGHLGPPTTPVAGYTVWLDAADTATITASGGAVSQWTDKSASAYTFTQATAGKKPTTGTRTQNGKNVLDMDGGDVLISSNAASTWTFLSNNTQWTAFVAFNMDTGSFQTIMNTDEDQSDYIGSALTMNDGPAYSFRQLTTRAVSGTYVVVNDTAANSLTTAFTYVTVLSDANNATAANRSDIRIKQGSAIKNNTQTNNTNNGTPNYTLEIGMPNGLGAYGLDGTLGEILIYDSTLSAGNILLNQQYLAGKWGV